MVIETKTRNAEKYDEYIAKVPSIISRYGGRYLVRGGKATPLAGSWTPERLVILEFPSRDHITRCFSSAEYREIAPLREAGADACSVVVDGYAENTRGATHSPISPCVSLTPATRRASTAAAPLFRLMLVFVWMLRLRTAAFLTHHHSGQPVSLQGPRPISHHFY